MEFYVAGKRHRVDPTQSKGRGGEAEVFDLGNGTVAKLWKQPDHGDFAGQPALQNAAENRIAMYQRKIRHLPKLPSRVVTPIAMCESRRGDVLGYTMPFVSDSEVLLSYSLQSFRSAVGYEATIKALLDLHSTIVSAHNSIVFGDFNDLNVLVRDGESFVIDIDSCQFGPYQTAVFTEKFVDPTLVNQEMILCRPHNQNSDWYAYAIMVMQSLLFVGPYGGVYRPKNHANKIPQGHRPLKRITVFHPEVMYPKPAVPMGKMPDDLMKEFARIFDQDKRGQFPSKHLQDFRWTTCTVCGCEHARPVCPDCKQAMPAAVKATITVRGTVACERIFVTNGNIVFASAHDGELRWLWHDGTRFLREDGSCPMVGAMHQNMRMRIRGSETMFGMNGLLVSIPSDEKLSVDGYLSLAQFDTNQHSKFWIHGGTLYRNGQHGPKRIGDVLANQTLFWAGPKFGFGFYRAGNISQSFVYDVDGSAINDSAQSPPIRGQLIDSTAVFSNTKCWFIYSVRESGRTINRCCVYDRAGAIVARAETEDGDSSWLGHIRGKAAAGDMLLCATDDGIVRVEPTPGENIIETKRYPDTEPFVGSSDHIFIGKKGLYAVSQKEIRLLKIS